MRDSERTRRRNRRAGLPAITRRHLTPSVGGVFTMPVLRLRVGERPRAAGSVDVKGWTSGFCWN